MKDPWVLSADWGSLVTYFVIMRLVIFEVPYRLCFSKTVVLLLACWSCQVLQAHTAPRLIPWIRAEDHDVFIRMLMLAFIQRLAWKSHAF